MSTATGIGSWPGTDVSLAQRLVRDSLADTAHGLPYLPELPARGPGADLIGRGAGLLADLPVDLQPSGWRLVDRPGLDAHRTRAMLRRDLDDLAEVFDGYTGRLKVQVAGPWTLAAHVRLARGERVVGDLGAARDLAQSLAEGVRRHVAQVRRLLPGADVVVQVDEPSLPAVLAGRLPTSSGYGMHRAVDAETARRGLTDVIDAAAEDAGDGRGPVVVHCCAPEPPLSLLREAGARAIALDVTLLDPRGWERVAAEVEAGVALWAGLDADADGRSMADTLRPLVDGWQRVGLPSAALDGVTVTPTCGLAGATPERARRVHARLPDVAAALTEYAAG